MVLHFCYIREDISQDLTRIDEMADQFPHVKFTGCNFVPTRHPHHPNIQLEIYNLNEGFRGRDEYYDLIRMEGCFKTVCTNSELRIGN